MNQGGRAVNFQSFVSHTNTKETAMNHILAKIRGKFFQPLKVALIGVEGSGKTTLLKTLRGRKYAKLLDDRAYRKVEDGVKSEESVSVNYRMSDSHGFCHVCVTDYRGEHLGSAQFRSRIIDGADAALILVRASQIIGNGETADALKKRYRDVCSDLSGIRAAVILMIAPDDSLSEGQKKDLDVFLEELSQIVQKGAGLEGEFVARMRFQAASREAKSKEEDQAEKEAAKPFLWISRKISPSIWKLWRPWMAMAIIGIAAVAVVSCAAYLSHKQGQDNKCKGCGKAQSACESSCTHDPCVCTNTPPGNGPTINAPNSTGAGKNNPPADGDPKGNGKGTQPPICKGCGKVQSACESGCTHNPCVCTNTPPPPSPQICKDCGKEQKACESGCTHNPCVCNSYNEVVNKTNEWSKNKLEIRKLCEEYWKLYREFRKAPNFDIATEFVAGKIGPTLIEHAEEIKKKLSDDSPSRKNAEELEKANDDLRALCDRLCRTMVDTPLGSRWECKFAQWFSGNAYKENYPREAGEKRRTAVEMYRISVTIDRAVLHVVNSDAEYQVALSLDATSVWDASANKLVKDQNVEERWLIRRPKGYDKDRIMKTSNAGSSPTTMKIEPLVGKIALKSAFDAPWLYLYVCRKGEKAKHLRGKPDAKVRVSSAEPFFNDVDDKERRCRKLSYTIDRKTKAEVQCWLYGTESAIHPLEELEHIKNGGEPHK